MYIYHNTDISIITVVILMEQGKFCKCIMAVFSLNKTR